MSAAGGLCALPTMGKRLPEVPQRPRAADHETTSTASVGARVRVEREAIMAPGLPAPPPNLPGFSYVRVLGSGGFADVFLYEQNMPRRQVAVKVMLNEVVNEQGRQVFQPEANPMARVSAPPAILTVYQASVSADGRPYLVMELCSASLSERYRRE